MVAFAVPAILQIAGVARARTIERKGTNNADTLCGEGDGHACQLLICGSGRATSTSSAAMTCRRAAR